MAALAHLNLSPEQVRKFQQELSTVLGYVEKLQEIDVSKVEPVMQINGLVNVMREDTEIPEQQLTSEEALSNAQRQAGGYFEVGRII